MDSFEQIYTLYFKDVYRYTLSLCHNTEAAEEITQETFFQAMKHMPSFRGGCKMTVWLCQITKHLYFAEYKKQKRRQGTAEAGDFTGGQTVGRAAAQVPEGTGTSATLEQRLCEEADAMKIHEFLHGLCEPYKEVFMLRVFAELPFKKIACIFGKTENWARVTYYRAKLKIICAMEESNG